MLPYFLILANCKLCVTTANIFGNFAVLSSKHQLAFSCVETRLISEITGVGTHGLSLWFINAAKIL